MNVASRVVIPSHEQAVRQGLASFWRRSRPVKSEKHALWYLKGKCARFCAVLRDVSDIKIIARVSFCPLRLKHGRIKCIICVQKSKSDANRAFVHFLGHLQRCWLIVFTLADAKTCEYWQSGRVEPVLHHVGHTKIENASSQSHWIILRRRDPSKTQDFYRVWPLIHLRWLTRRYCTYCTGVIMLRYFLRGQHNVYQRCDAANAFI